MLSSKIKAAFYLSEWKTPPPFRGKLFIDWWDMDTDTSDYWYYLPFLHRYLKSFSSNQQFKRPKLRKSRRQTTLPLGRECVSDPSGRSIFTLSPVSGQTPTPIIEKQGFNYISTFLSRIKKIFYHTTLDLSSIKMASRQYSILLYQAENHPNHRDPAPCKSQMQRQWLIAPSEGTQQSISLGSRFKLSKYLPIRLNFCFLFQKEIA